MSASSLDIDWLRLWIGREESAQDIVTPRLTAALRATLDVARYFPLRNHATPVMTHWCLTPPLAPMSQIDADGHPQRGGFLPPAPLPRRMWASSEIRILDPLRDFDTVTRRSRIADVITKTGGSGVLLFVSVDHLYESARGPAIEERQNIVYRDANSESPSKNATNPSAPVGRFSVSLRAEEVLLMRYSALSFNAHRIHYDRAYAQQAEGLPGLVVQGPLLASLLAEYAASLRGGPSPQYFAFRALVPLFDRQDFTLHANPHPEGFDLWIVDAAGSTNMRAQGRW